MRAKIPQGSERAAVTILGKSMIAWGEHRAFRTHGTLSQWRRMMCWRRDSRWFEILSGGCAEATRYMLHTESVNSLWLQTDPGQEASCKGVVSPPHSVLVDRVAAWYSINWCRVKRLIWWDTVTHIANTDSGSVTTIVERIQ